MSWVLFSPVQPLLDERVQRVDARNQHLQVVQCCDGSWKCMTHQHGSNVSIEWLAVMDHTTPHHPLQFPPALSNVCGAIRADVPACQMLLCVVQRLDVSRNLLHHLLRQFGLLQYAHAVRVIRKVECTHSLFSTCAMLNTDVYEQCPTPC